MNHQTLGKIEKDRTLGAFRAAVVCETNSEIYVCNDTVVSALDLLQGSRVPITKAVRAMFAPKKVFKVYPVTTAALNDKMSAGVCEIYFVCTKCNVFTTLDWHWFCIRSSESPRLCTKCFRGQSDAVAETIRKFNVAGRSAAYRMRNSRTTKPFTISEKFKAYLEQTYCKSKPKGVISA